MKKKSDLDGTNTFLHEACKMTVVLSLNHKQSLVCVKDRKLDVHVGFTISTNPTELSLLRHNEKEKSNLVLM